MRDDIGQMMTDPAHNINLHSIMKSRILISRLIRYLVRLT